MKTRTTWGVVLIASVLILTLLLLTSRESFIGRQTLKDGGVLTLLSVKVGNKHEAPRTTLRQSLAKWVPAKWRQYLKTWPPPVVHSAVSSNYVSIWFSIRRTNLVDWPFTVMVSDDEENCCFEDRSYSSRVETRSSSNVWLYGIPFPSWPRRAETVRIEFYPPESDYPREKLAEFRVKNPAYDPHTSPWTAPRWPITVRDEDLEFTLTSLWAGAAWDNKEWKLYSAGDRFSRGTRGSFRVTRNGILQTNWLAFAISDIRDATGNRVRYPDGNISTIRNSETMIRFSRPPPPVKEPWRITVEFSRSSGFEKEELQTVTFPLPQAGSPLPAAVTNFGQVPLIVHWESSPLDPSPYIIAAAVHPQTIDYRLTLVQAVDDKGRKILAERFGHGFSLVYNKLSPAPDARSVDLVFAYHRSKQITFQVKPEFYKGENK